ncbi:Acetylcholinesterase [Dactylellina cionopaga]|nr:Acetylcholinesterase [Dactylellina cionopaga]
MPSNHFGWASQKLRLNAQISATSAQYQVTVKARKQTITGFRDAAGFRFDGVRYAPTPKRFEHSTTLDAEGSVDALAFGSQCLQPGGGSEDCLFLNIATPHLPSASQQEKNLKPVIFFIHGGGFIHGSGNLRNYDGVNLASRGDVVVVKFNYRLGSFGFLATDKEGAGITGNYGIGDQITALKWVSLNIAAFGGDPSRITISGDSAGAMSVRVLMASEAAKGFFAAAIMQSPPIGLGSDRVPSTYLTLKESTAKFEAILEESGCSKATDPVVCIKTLDGAALNELVTVGNWPVVDRKILSVPDLPLTGNAYIAPVPLIIGTTRDETAIMLSPVNAEYYGDIYSTYDYLDFAGTTPEVFGNVNKNLTLFANHPAFPLPKGGDPDFAAFNVTVRVLTDAIFKCGSWSTAYLAAKHNTLPKVYVYEVNQTYQPLEYTAPECEPPNNDPSKEYFKCHAGDVDSMLGALQWDGLKPRDRNDFLFSELLMDYWTSFAWNHDPNPKQEYLFARGYWNTLEQVGSTGKWESLKADKPKMRRLQWNGYQTDLSEREQCEALGMPLDYLANLPLP